jgi:acyl-CoA dehydrogenase
MTFIGTLLLLIVLWVLAYHAAGSRLWLTLPPLTLALLQGSGQIAAAFALPLWLLYGLAAFLHFVPELRRRWITTPLLKQFQRVMPTMSSTEKEALNAGNIWWDGELFSGRPDWRQLLDQTPAQLSEREQAFIDGPVEELCRQLDDWRITHQEQDLPPQTWSFIKRSGLFGMIIPQEYGGLGFSALAHSTVVMKVASRSITAAVTVMVPNSLGPAKLLLHYGTQAQKQRYLQRLASGQEIPCFALTGPQAGSDAGAMPDRGVVGYGDCGGRRTLGIRLNWDKRYITLAPVATLIGLAFKLEDPEQLLGLGAAPGITIALIPSDTPGVETGERHLPLNIPFQNGPTRGRDVFIPLDWVIGGQAGVGQGWRMLMESLAEGRSISLPALATGAGKLASRYTGAYAGIRRQFGLPIGRFEGVEEALGRIAGMTYQMDAARQLTLTGLDQGERPSVISAIVKYHLTERYRQVINDAMDVQGGSGICLGPANLLGRAYQAIPIAITVEGANILTRSMIIFGQGAIRCHPYLLREFESACNPDAVNGLNEFDTSFFGHVGYLLTNLARSFWLGLSHGRLSGAPGKGNPRRYFQYLNWMSAAFALTADLSLMTLGSALKRKERLSARLGDLLSELYIASASLKRFHDDGEPAQDLPLLQWAMEDSLHRIHLALRGLFRNIPLRPLGWLLRILVFPTGQPFHTPSDRLDRAVAALLLRPGETRDRLTRHVYLSDDPEDPVGVLELALQAVTAALPVERTLREAKKAGQLQGDSQQLIEQALEIGLLKREDVDKLALAERLRNRVIQVDAFASLTGIPTPMKTMPDDPRHLGAA